jgi:hypothetical protein
VPFNVLLLPLLGGYVFIKYWNKTRFDASRYSGERLLFHAALAGVVFLVMAFAVTTAVTLWKPLLAEWWRSRIPFPYAGTSLVAFLLGTVVWWPFNKWFSDRDWEIQRTIAEWNDYLEGLLNRAVREGRQVAVSLRNGKVYVGLVTRNFDPSYDREYLVLLPTISGYREPPSQALRFTTDYTRVYQELLQTDESFDAAASFEVVLPVAEVVSATFFDWDVYRRFNPRATEAA